ncbi:MAG: glycosyltransferase [Phycisphaerales bacterium]|nr:glycosyltransferase [Phycisphaerales bacterium]
MNKALAVAIPTCCGRSEDIRIGYVLESLALQPPSDYFDSLDIYIWDEGVTPVTSDRWVRLVMDLLVHRGHSPHYIRRGPSRGVAEARRNLIATIPSSHDKILLVDDDLLVMPGAIDSLLAEAAKAERFGFIQGTKIELDASRTYHNDINQLTEHAPDQGATRIWFGDAAFLLVNRDALRHVKWELMTRFREEGLPGEDVAMTLMIADREPCYGVAAAAGYHMPLSSPRWRWEVPSDLLQFEMLKSVVSAETLERAMPHLAKYIRNQTGAVSDSAGVGHLPHAEGKSQ